MTSVRIPTPLRRLTGDKNDHFLRRLNGEKDSSLKKLRKKRQNILQRYKGKESLLNYLSYEDLKKVRRHVFTLYSQSRFELDGDVPFEKQGARNFISPGRFCRQCFYCYCSSSETFVTPKSVGVGYWFLECISIIKVR